MSTAQENTIPQLSELLDELQQFGEPQARIVSTDEDIQFTPPIVTRINGILPFDTNTDQYLCGTTETTRTTDSNWRATMEGVAYLRHLSVIKRLREETDGEVLLLTPMTLELGTERVNFDRIELDRPQDLNKRPVRHNGEVVREPIYTFQFQSKEDSNE